MNHETAQLAPAARSFTVILSPTPRGARLARLLTAAQLHDWGMAPDLVHTAQQVVAELASNAATHGRVRGRDFLLGLATAGEGRTLRVEVTDTRGDSLPRLLPCVPPPDDETGRGLLLVEALADRWGVVPGPVPRKTVWAEIDLRA
ncbi:ATP-binding protein [Streptomyces nitrosporeus]|uniref:ATP-binding protein n=1 Tax=Streptomyces nitrosporeus TaxID=28894 RepID=UPI003330F6BA